MRKNISVSILILMFFCAVPLCSCAKCEEHVYSKPCDSDCNICGEKRTLPDDVEHRVKMWKSNGDFTCERDGTKSGTCMFCCAPVTVVDEGSATGHDNTENYIWIFNSDNTHTEDGTETQRCYFCNKPGETRVAVGSAGHNFGTNDITKVYKGLSCKECGWKEPSLPNTDIYAYGAFEPFRDGYAFNGIQFNQYSKLRLEVWTQKKGVKYTVAGVDRGDNTNIRALKVEREAVSEEANNDAIVDIVLTEKWSGSGFPTDMSWEFDLMIGEGNRSDIYLSSRKETEERVYYNIFLWYCAETEQILLGDTVVAENITAGEWHNVALVIDDEAKTYDVYIDGETVFRDVGYLNSEYPAAGECGAEFYRITAMKGTEAVEFYLDNVKLCNSEENVEE